MHIDVPPGEYELWRGSPTRYRVMTWAEVKAIPGELVGLGLIWLFWQIEWFHIHPLLLAAGAALILYRFPVRPLVRWWLLATTEYLLTDKQVVTTNRPFGFRRTRHSPLKSLREPELHDESDEGYGTIVFANSGVPAWMLTSGKFVPTLRGIPDARAVLEKIEARLD